MRKTIQQVCKRCITCQINKPKLRKLGHLPAKTVEEIPWEKVCIDLIGPYTIGSPKKSDKITLHCLTMIEPVTGWFEIAEIPAKSADVVADIFERTWLVRYPRPAQVTMDRGCEFMAEMQCMPRDDYGIEKKMTTTRNPQANSMVDHAHHTVHQLIHSQSITGKKNLPQVSWAGILSAVAFAMRATQCTPPYTPELQASSLYL